MSASETPPAFPVFAFPWVTPDELCTGMTLRDHFAGQALPSVIDMVAIDPKGDAQKWFQTVARISFALADAMLAERAKGGAA